MPSRTKRVFFKDYAFNVYDNVYEPAEDSFLFAENLSVNERDSVVDMGTGCGILGIIASTKATRTVAIDINPYAVRCAKENAKLNNVMEKMSIVQGDLFAPLRAEEKFDLILFNAPYLPAEHGTGDYWLERAWNGGATGRQIIDRFMLESPRHLKPAGRILLLQSSLSNTNKTLKGFEGRGFRTRTIAKLDLPFFESIILIEAKFK
jgi:release factor glutamine methyltransferase